MSSSVSESAISTSGESTTEFSTSGLSLKTDRSKSPFADFKDGQITTSSVSESGISTAGESTTEFSTSEPGRSKSPLHYLKDERISTSELVLAWLDQVEISPEFQNTEDESLEQDSISEEKMEHLAMLLREIGARLERDDLFEEAIKSLNAKSNQQRLVQTMTMLGAAGLITIMSLLRL